jgi:hypothetical protein
MKKQVFIIILIAFALVAGSCTKKKIPDRIVLPQTSFLTEQKSWGVVTSNYLRLRQKPSQNADTLSGLTKGSVVELVASTDRKETIDGNSSFWYRVNMDGLQGWVFGAYLDIFPNEADARSSARELK